MLHWSHIHSRLDRWKKKQWGKGSISDIFSLEMRLNCIWREDVMLLLHSVCWKSDKSCSEIMKDFKLLGGAYNLLRTDARHPAPHPPHDHKYNYRIHQMQAWLPQINLTDIHKQHADILLMSLEIHPYGSGILWKETSGSCVLSESRGVSSPQAVCWLPYFNV